MSLASRDPWIELDHDVVSLSLRVNVLTRRPPRNVLKGRRVRVPERQIFGAIAPKIWAFRYATSRRPFRRSSASAGSARSRATTNVLRHGPARIPRSRDASDMRGIYLRGKSGQLVQLDALANVQEGVGARQINHFNRVPAFTLSASLLPGLAQGEALDSLDGVRARCLPPGSTTALAASPVSSRECRRVVLRVRRRAARRVHGAGITVRVAGAPLDRAAGVPLAITGALATLKRRRFCTGRERRSTCTARSACLADRLGE